MATISAIGVETTSPRWERVGFNITDNRDNAISIMDMAYWDELARHPLHRAATFINDNGLFILSGIGIPFNLLSFLVLRRIKPLSSAILIMMILALIDTLKLFIECSNRAAEITGFSYTDTGCLFLMTVRYLMQYFPIWLVVLLNVERVVAVCFPLKATSLCTVSNARRSIILLVIMDIPLCIVHTFIYEELPHPRGYGCYVRSRYINFMEKWMILDSLFFVVIPLIALCLGNFAIIIKLQTSAEIPNASAAATQDQETKRQNRSITIMLLAVCITTIVCLVPNSVLSLTDLIGWARTNTGDIRTDALNRLVNRMMVFLTDANNAVNFFLYVLCGRRFRTVLREMISSWVAK